ncbi:YrhC family protein [Bacillus sp. 165]|uniref:YrhC family protein n=1 Tax=Bacillus sp. 165 TaxID=1529117 RepID=UPI001ADBE883|nr:YrhC family protein [Bacillus sp. 165]MBO9130437.1 hypothetical protein [Bacillus sp. 165]
MKNKLNSLQHKIADYTRFGQVLLAVGTLLFIGIILPDNEKELSQLLVMIGASLGALGASLFFFYRVKKLRDIEVEEM